MAGPKHRKVPSLGFAAIGHDPWPDTRCDKQPSCPLCHPAWYAARRARHKKTSATLVPKGSQEAAPD